MKIIWICMLVLASGVTNAGNPMDVLKWKEDILSLQSNGEIRKFQLPNSKLLVTYSTKYFRMVEEDVNTLNPDILVETTFNEFAAGVDPVLEAIIKY